MGLDIGERRVGVALSDISMTVASPFTTLDASCLATFAPLIDLAEEYEVTEVVVGLPVSLDGSEGPQAERVRAVVSRLAVVAPVPVRVWDERLSSVEARRVLRESGVRVTKGLVDRVAASFILQGYLDSLRSAEEAGDQ